MRHGLASVLVFSTLNACMCGETPADEDAGARPGPISDGGSTVEPWDAGPPPSVSATGCWSAPIGVAPSGAVGRARLAALPTGEALVVWSSFDEGWRYQAQRFTPEGGRGPRSELFAAGPFELGDYRLASNLRGDAVAVWQFIPDGGPEQRLLSRRFSLDAGWGPVETVTDTPTFGISASMTSTGDAFVSWVLPISATGFPALLARRTLGGRWLERETLSAAMWYVASVQLAADELAVIAWAQYGPPTFETEWTSSLWASGSRLERLVNRRPVPMGGSLDSLAVRGGDAALALEVASSEFLIHRLVDTEWRPGPRILRSGEALPRAGVDAAGRLTIWSTAGPPNGETLVAITETEDAGWSQPIEVARQTEPLRFIVSASNSSGRALLGWPKERSFVVRTDPDGGADDLIDGLGFAPADPPQLAVSSSGVRWILGYVNEPGTRAVLLVCR